MLTPNDITAAVSTAVRGLFPGETVHENLVPRSFPRPCNMVELTGIALGEVSPGGVELLYTYRITDFVEVDERHNSQLSKLDHDDRGAVCHGLPEDRRPGAKGAQLYLQPQLRLYRNPGSSVSGLQPDGF